MKVTETIHAMQIIKANVSHFQAFSDIIEDYKCCLFIIRLNMLHILHCYRQTLNN